MGVNCYEAKGRKKKTTKLIPLCALKVLRDLRVQYLALPDTQTVLENSHYCVDFCFHFEFWFWLKSLYIWSCLLPSFQEFIRERPKEVMKNKWSNEIHLNVDSADITMLCFSWEQTPSLACALHKHHKQPGEAHKRPFTPATQSISSQVGSATLDQANLSPTVQLMLMLLLGWV